MDTLDLDGAVVSALVLVARIVAGVIFLRSSLGKLRAPGAFVDGVETYDVLPKPLACAVGWLLPWLELGLALTLLAGVALPVAGALASLLLLRFIIAVGINLRRGRMIACNCHGIADTRTISSGTIARNAVLLALMVPLVVSPFTFSIEAWRAAWQVDLAFVSAPDIGIMVVLLIVCRWVFVQLAEWLFDIRMRVAAVKTLALPERGH